MIKDKYIEINFNKPRILLLILLNVFLLSSCVISGRWVYFHSINIPLGLYLAIPLFVVLSFSLCFYILLLFRREPGLILDAKGIISNTPPITKGLIAWRSINKISVETFGRLIKYRWLIIYYDKFDGDENPSVVNRGKTSIHPLVLDIQSGNLIQLIDRYYKIEDWI